MKKNSLKLNAILNIVKTLAILLFPLITFPVVSIALGPENTGRVDFSNSFVSYFSIIASLGISAYAIRECSILKEDKERLEKTASEIFSINILTTLISYCLLALSLLVYKIGDSYRILIYISSTTLIFNAFSCDWINYVCEEYLFVTIRTIVLKLVFVILVVIYIKSPAQTVLYTVFTVVISNIVSILNVVFRGGKCKIRFTTKLNLKTHFKPVMILFAINVSESVLNNLDITMLGILENDYIVGLYGFAFKIKMMMAQLLNAVIVVFVPRCSFSYSQGDFDSFNTYFKKAFQFVVYFIIPAIIGVILISPQIVLLFGGGKFDDSVWYLRVLSFSLAIASFGTYLVGNLFLIPAKHEIKYMVASLAGMAVNVVLNFILIPLFGGIAAAITTCISELVMMLFMIWHMDKRIKVSGIKKTILNSIIALSLMIGIFILLNTLALSLWIRTTISIIVCSLFYYLVLYVIKDEFIIEFTRLAIQRVISIKHRLI